LKGLPLCVDLDGTLILTDALVETAKQLIFTKPWVAVLIPVWMLRGRAVLKRKIADRTQLDPGKLPYNAPFLTWLKAEKAKGRRLILATASDQIIADRIEAHLRIFDEVLGSDGTHNLKAENKLHRLQEQFGDAFEYAGNSSADIPIWEHCQSAVVVNASDSVRARAEAIGRVSQIFPRL
jgi:phosphoserine phosphatase